MLVRADERASDDRREREATDRGQSVPLQRPCAGEESAVAEVVITGERKVSRRHAKAGDELAGGHVRALLAQEEGFRIIALGNRSESRQSERRQRDKMFLHCSPSIVELRATRGAHSHRPNLNWMRQGLRGA